MPNFRMFDITKPWKIEFDFLSSEGTILVQIDVPSNSKKNNLCASNFCAIFYKICGAKML